MSSSHRFLGLPIGLLVLYFELTSGFHSAAFDQPSLFLSCCYSHRQSPFHFSLSQLPTSYLLVFHLFGSFNGAPIDVFNPIFFFDLSSVNLFVIVTLE